MNPFDVLECALGGINLVEASAGTGKTWNICGLYLRLLLERGLDVRQILVLTFTKAATAELRERVRARIVEMLAYVSGRASVAGDPFVVALTRALEARGASARDMRDRLDAALQSFDEAAILTIHGWCQRALAQTPFAAALPFALDIEPDDAELRLATVHDFWRRHIAGEACPPALAAWLEAKKVTPESLSKLLARHLAKPLARVQWPADIDAPLALDEAALQEAYETARATWAAAQAEILDAMQRGLAALKGPGYSQKVVLQAFGEWEHWLAHDVLCPIKWKDSKLERLTTSCLERNTKKGAHAPEHRFFAEADRLVDLRKRAEAELDRARLRLVRRLFDEAGPALRERKRAARTASYDDLLHNLHKALQAPGGAALACRLRDTFPAALIDEFQDTDPVQFAIVQAIYGDGEAPLFLVGDPKQAIYAFRNADLHTYLQAARHVKARWTLAHNQRSTAGLVTSVNRLFDANPRAFMLPGLDYHDVQVGAKRRATLADRRDAGAELRIWTLPPWDAGQPQDRASALEAAATATAAEIARLLRAAAAGELTLDGRPLAPHDIAVLVRTHRQGDGIKQALAALGVGSVELSQATVFKSPDAEDVERVLVAVQDPGDDGLLRAALATGIVGMDARAIAALDDDEAAYLACVQRFQGYRDTWRDAGVGVMYRDMLTREGVATRMLARTDGERRLTNLLHLGELLHGAEQAHRAPDALLRWLSAQRRDDARDEIAQLRLESDRNLVQIVTIHKVKGLEYPVVFCPFLWDAYQRAAPNGLEGREYHDRDGSAVIDFRSDAAMGDEAATIRALIRREKCAEDLRLAYVALTRASHRCYLVAGCYARMYYGKPSAKETTGGVLNWLVAGAGTEPDAWLDGNAAAPGAIDAAWQRLATDLAPHAACSPLPTCRGEPVSPTRPSPESIAALAPPARLADPWRISSFSGLYRGAVSESAASDHDVAIAAGEDDGAAVSDEPAPVRRRSARPAELPADDILRFPRGIGAGDCLHTALEHADFSDPGSWDRAIDDALRAHPVSMGGTAAAEHPLLHRMVARMLRDVVATELADGIRLDAIPPVKRLTELAFNMPASRLAAPALNAALKSLGYGVDRLTFGELRGYLNGFIDLVFEHGGRFYLLDWKSNHLGHAREDYAQGALERAMAEHGYHLQALIYAVALTRYLARRVPGYRHDTHFGGVVYAFVRGVRPAWRTPDGRAAGVHFHRPDAETLARLDRLLQPHDAGIAA